MAQMKITDGKGVHFELDNGIVISIQIGGGNYSDNYNEPIGLFSQLDRYTLPPSSTAEIALWGADGDFADIGGDMVKGYVRIEEVLRFVDFLRALPSELTKAEIELAVSHFDWRDRDAA